MTATADGLLAPPLSPPGRGKPRAARRVRGRLLSIAALIAVLGCLPVFPAAPARAAQSYRVNNGTVGYVNEWSVCRKITNWTGGDLFIPTNTGAEWSSFYTYPPGGATVAACPTWVYLGFGQINPPYCSDIPGFADGGYCNGYEGTVCCLLTGPCKRYSCQ